MRRLALLPLLLAVLAGCSNGGYKAPCFKAHEDSRRLLHGDPAGSPRARHPMCRRPEIRPMIVYDGTVPPDMEVIMGPGNP